MSSKGYHWYNNGLEQVNALECPPGFVKGMLRSSVEKSKETNRKLREEGKVKIRTPEEEQARVNKMSNTKRKWLYDFCAEHTYDDMYNLFIEQNKTYTELQLMFDLTEHKLMQILKHYNLFKPRTLSIQKGLETKYQQAGSKEEYYKKQHQSLIDNLTEKGITEKEYYKQVSDKLRETKQKLYGDPNYRDLEKVKQTCQEKYGVDYPCQRIEARSHSANNSVPNVAFKQLLVDNNIEYIEEFALGSYSYDFKVGDILIEINPFATHNSTWGVFGNDPKDKNYHFKKTMFARSLGYRCINVWDWDDVNKIVRLLKNKENEKIYARKCEVREVSTNIASEYLNTYHLQLYAKSSVNVGLYYDGELVSLITFGKPRYNKNYEWELVRYCYSKVIVGGVEKLFNYFLETYQPNTIVSYCDNSKFFGGVYDKLGFKLDTLGQPGKHWYNPKTKRHITDNLLRQQGFDHLFGTDYGKGTSNEQLMIEYGFLEIYDAGQSRYSWQIDIV